MPETILIIEDEEDVSDLIRYHLRKSKYRILTARDGAEGVSLAFAEKPDAIILDIMLPKLNGFEVTKQLREKERTAEIPLLILSAKRETDSRIRGLELGADDYLAKPFSPKELLLRIQALLRRKGTPSRELFSSGRLVLDRTLFRVTLDGRRLDLTTTEFKILSLLLGKTGTICSREDLLQEVWGYKNSIDTRTVDTHIRRLREKLGACAVCLETVRGEGYRFHPPVEAS